MTYPLDDYVHNSSIIGPPLWEDENNKIKSKASRFGRLKFTSPWRILQALFKDEVCNFAPFNNVLFLHVQLPYRRQALFV